MNKYIIGVCLVILVIVGAVYFSKNKDLNGTGSDPLLAGDAVLKAIKDADYQKLESLTSSDGLSWDHYINLDLKDSKYHIPKDRISSTFTNSEKRLFGYADGSGAPIVITGNEYMKKYVYRHDYLDATNTKVTIIKPSVDITNEQDKFVMSQMNLYGGIGSRIVTAHHYADPAANDFDYSTIYLVFDTENGEYKLRGIARYYWTI